MTELNTEPLSTERLIKSGIQWSLSESGILSVAIMGDDGDLYPHSVTDKDLAAIHEKLPHAVHAFLDYNQKYYRAHVIFGEEVRDTLSMLQSETIEIDNGNNKYLFISLEGIEPGETPAEVVLHGVTLRTSKCQSPVGPILIASRRASTQLTVAIENLEKQFPGWEKRLEVGRQLGIVNAELFQYVFTEDHLLRVPTELSGLTF